MLVSRGGILLEKAGQAELWDVYDSQRNLTGRTHRRGDPLPPGDYYLTVHVWLRNSKGEFLISRRAPTKGDPNKWECPGGSAMLGDDSLAAAIREVKEEVGLDICPDKARLMFTITTTDEICDVWLFQQDFNIEDVVLQESEVTAAKYATTDEIRSLAASGEFIRDYIEDFFAMVE